MDLEKDLSRSSFHRNGQREAFSEAGNEFLVMDSL